MPVSMDDGTAIAGSARGPLPLPEWPEVAWVFCRWLAQPQLSELVGVRNAVAVS